MWEVAKTPTLSIVQGRPGRSGPGARLATLAAFAPKSLPKPEEHSRTPPKEARVKKRFVECQACRMPQSKPSCTALQKCSIFDGWCKLLLAEWGQIPLWATRLLES